jgi:serine/threonine protein kinase
MIFEAARWVALAVCFLLFAFVAAYVVFGLPRLRNQLAIVMTALLTVLLCFAATLASGVLKFGLLGCAIALVGAQGGWFLGRRSLRFGTQQVKLYPLKPHITPQIHPEAFSSTLPAPIGTSSPLFSSEALSTTQYAKIGPFQIEKEIGRGSMGAVYLGVDPAGRHLAIKALALDSDFDGDALAEARSRFVREAETAGRLRHSDIVSILDAGEDRGLAYIAMEYLQGHDLQGYTRQGQLLPVTRVLHIVARVADALAYAHRQGIVHRDIKPANVMVDLSRNMVKIMDFGIAHVTDAQRTRTGLVLGTPSYMSPEQLAGGAVDGRSDIYSLGVMLFQLLTGSLPHQADSMSRVLYLIANEPAPDVRVIRPGLPETLANVVTLALQKQPETRYADANQFASDLRDVANCLVSASASEMCGDHSLLIMRTAINLPEPPVATDPQLTQDFPSTVAVMQSDKRHNHNI